MQLVLVKWRDTVTAQGWHTRAGAVFSEEDTIVQSVGWIVNDTALSIILTQGCGSGKFDDDAFLNLQCIPRGMILSITELVPTGV